MVNLGNVVFRLLRDFFFICVARKTPDEVPYSVALLVTLLIFQVVLYLLINSFLLPEQSMVSLTVAFWTIILFSFLVISTLYILLKIFSFQSRFVQTIISIIGAQIIIDSVRISIVIISKFAHMFEVLSGLFALAFFLCIPWGLFAQMHILRHALSLSIITAAFLSISLYLLWQLYFIKLIEYFV